MFSKYFGFLPHNHSLSLYFSLSLSLCLSPYVALPRAANRARVAPKHRLISSSAARSINRVHTVNPRNTVWSHLFPVSPASIKFVHPEKIVVTIKVPDYYIN